MIERESQDTKVNKNKRPWLSQINKLSLLFKVVTTYTTIRNPSAIANVREYFTLLFYWDHVRDCDLNFLRLYFYQNKTFHDLPHASSFYAKEFWKLILYMHTKHQ